MPVAISFTLETDGRLPSGDTLAEAIQRTDEAVDGYPAYYMINCAHPTHFAQGLREGGVWCERIRGLRANASKRSHTELDESADLDVGNPLELGEEYRSLRALLPRLSLVGGCCGTDHRHLEAICAAPRRRIFSLPLTSKKILEMHTTTPPGCYGKPGRYCMGTRTVTSRPTIRCPRSRSCSMRWRGSLIRTWAKGRAMLTLKKERWHRLTKSNVAG